MKAMRRSAQGGMLAMLFAALMLAAPPVVMAQSDARWNALYDRIIRLEYEMKRMKRDYEARIRRLEAELRKARRGAGLRTPAPAPAAPPAAAGRRGAPLNTRTAGQALPPLPEEALRRPQVSVELERPGSGGAVRPEVELLGRIGEDNGVRGGGRLAPPPMRGETGAPRTPRAAGPIPLSGTITDALGVPQAGAPEGGGLAPGQVAVAPLPPVGGMAGAGAYGSAGTQGRPAPAPQPVNIPPALARLPAGKLLQKARQNFLARRYDQAEQAYRAFLARYADNPQATDARFELGETLYIRGQFKEAGRLFVDVYRAAPESRLAPRALLRLGQALKRMGRKKEACKAWQTLVERYPDSRAATLQAPREMKRLKCRGT